MSIIKLKRSETAATAPASLQYGEVAINITDKKIYIGNSSGATTLLIDGNASGGGVSSFNTRIGAVSLTSSDVATALGYTPQRQEPTLTAIANLSPDADDLIYFSGTDGAAITTLTSFGRSLIDDINASTARTTLGLAIGTNVQAWDADLDSIAALSGTSGVLKKTAANTWSLDTATYWTSSNDGTGSGLDADLIKGVDGNRIIEEIQTGLLYGGIITINGSDNTKIDITAGAGIIVSVNASTTTYPNPTVQIVTWTAKTGVSVSGIASNDFTFVRIDSSGNVQQSNNDFTQTEYLNSIVLGNVVHPNRTSIARVHYHPIVAYASSAQYETFIRYFGPLKVSGYAMSGYLTSGRLQHASGVAFALGSNMDVDVNNPSLVTDSSAVPISDLYYLYRNVDGSYKTNPTPVTTVQFGNYDNGSGTLGTISNNNWSTQRVYKIPGQNAVYVYYGTKSYSTDVVATTNLLTELTTEADITRFNGVFLGWMIVRGGGSNASSTGDCVFIPGGFFRNTNGGGGAATISNLDDLGDVAITSASANQLLYFKPSTSLWENASASTIGLVTLTGVETLTNKTLTSPTISNLYLSDGLILVEGTTNDSNEMSLVVDTLTADRTITFPNATGTVVTTGNLTSITSTGTIASGTWNGSAIGATYGGTGQTSYTTGDLLYASSSSALSKLTIGANNYVLTSDGTNPVWTANTGTGSVVRASSPTISSPTFTTPILGTPQSGTLTSCTGLPLTTGVTGTLAETNGGTNQSTYTLGDTLYSSASNTLSKLSGNTTTTKKFLSQTGTGSVSAAPAWDTVSKSDVGLGSVENTALSTWAGSTNITTLGTIGTGTWQGTAIGAIYGGTAQTSYAAGDLLYASATNTLSKLTKPASSTSLLQMTSAGVPSWVAMGTGIATFLTTPSSANLAAAITNETGSGSLVFGTSPTFGSDITINNQGAASTVKIQSTDSALPSTTYYSILKSDGDAAISLDITDQDSLSFIRESNSILTMGDVDEGLSASNIVIDIAGNFESDVVMRSLNQTSSTYNAVKVGPSTITIAPEANSSLIMSLAGTIVNGSYLISTDTSGTTQWVRPQIFRPITGTSGTPGTKSLHCAYCTGGTASATAVNTLVYYLPFIVAGPGNITVQAHFESTSTAPGASPGTVTAKIYANSSTNGQPTGSSLYDLGSITLTNTTNAVFTNATTVSLPPGQYWVGYKFSATPSLRRVQIDQGASYRTVGGEVSAGTNYIFHYFMETVASGATAPASVGTLSELNSTSLNGTFPGIMLQVT